MHPVIIDAFIEVGLLAEFCRVPLNGPQWCCGDLDVVSVDIKDAGCRAAAKSQSQGKLTPYRIFARSVTPFPLPQNENPLLY